MHWKLLDAIAPRTVQSAFWRGFGCSLVVGLAIILVIGPLTGTSQHFSGNLRNNIHDGYWELATNLAAGNGYVFLPGGPKILHRPPLAPWLYAPMTRLPVGMQRPAVVLLQSFLMGVGLAALFDLARRLLDLRIARLSSVLVLTYPWVYWHIKNPMNVIAQMTFLVLVADLASRELRSAHADAPTPSPSWPVRGILLGVAVGAGLLTHGTTLLSLPAMLLLTMVVAVVQGNRPVVPVMVVAGLVATVTVAPWTYRNWQISHRFIPIVSNGGFGYFCGNVHWGLTGLPPLTRAEDQQEEQRQALASAGVPGNVSEVIQFWGIVDAEMDRQLNQRMVEHVLRNPGLFVRKLALNSAEYYCPVAYDVFGPFPRTPGVFKRAERMLLSLWHIGLWALAITGLILSRHSGMSSGLWLTLAWVVVIALPYQPFLVHIDHAQYTFSTIPFLAILASAALVSIYDVRQRRAT